MPSPLNLRSRLSTVLALRADSPAPTPTPAPVPIPAPAAPAVRQDATPNALGSTLSGAAMSNAMSGMGLPSDSASTTRPNIGRAYLVDEELVALLRGTIYRRIVEIYPREATREGWDILDDTDDVRPLHDMQRDLNVQGVFRQADTWARTFGESRVWMITKDGSELNEPLDPSTVTELKALQVFDKTELSPASYTYDVESPNFGRPETFWITPRRVGIAVNNAKPVHYTRLLRFFGEPLPPSRSGTAGQTWGDADAVGQTLWDAIRHLGDISGGGAKLAQELTMAVFHFANAAGATAGSDRSAWLSKLSTLVQMKSNWQAVFLGVQDKFERLGSNASGFKDLSDHAKAELAMLTEIPVELLYGQAPGGFTSDGSSWQANWHARVGAYQQEHIRPPLEQLVEVMYYADRGAVPDEWAVKFRPLAKLTPMELADLRLKHTQADQVALLDGVLTPERVARRYEDGEFSLEIQPLTPEEEAEQERDRAGESDPELLAQAEAALLAARADALDKAFRQKRFKIPAGASGNARKVLDWQEEHGDEVGGMTATGWRRARQLANDETVSGQDLIDIAAWGARHAGNADLSAEFKDEPWRDNGYVAWLGWGGDSMVNAAMDIVARNRDGRTDAAGDGVVLWVLLPPEARPEYDEMVAEASHAAGVTLRGEASPHVTVLYLGKVDPLMLPAVERIARRVVAERQPMQLRPCGVELLGSAEAPAVVQRIRSWDLQELHDALLRALAHMVVAPQYPRFRAHTTLGYAPPLTDEQASSVLGLQPVDEFSDEGPMWTASALQLVSGDDLVATLPLLGAGFDDDRR